ncbi:MAG: T9SS type A sorting domain-containing protein [Candidatus Eisenbacteria sp.]|nr:T9SS type A sorting domain-containing protein [Candidatus Eisenbacteria bacterium]
MRPVVCLVMALSLALPLVALDAAALPIIEIHRNNSSGEPLDLGTVVTISGIVTSPDGIYSTYHSEVYIQDETAGVNMWVSGAFGVYNLALGDSVTLTAPIDFYNGLTELGTSTSQVTLTNHSSGNMVPDPLEITCQDLNFTFQPDYTEPNEGRLIQVNNLTIVSGSWPVTPQPSNTILNVTDGTATSLLFIDKDSDVNGSPAPIGPFDCIGILKQYDNTPPYTSGYEISPRYVTDIIHHSPGPLFTVPPYVSDVTSTTATIEWETNIDSDSWVDYGETIAYGSGTGQIGETVPHHVVDLSGLTPNTVYHFRAQSTNGGATSQSNDYLLVTASDTPGEIHVFFNGSVDNTYALSGNNAQGNVDLLDELLARIHGAQYSIDCCLYSFSLYELADSLIAAHNRGVEVRLIKDADLSNTQANRLGAAGIPWINSDYGGNHSAADGYGICHNKFFVFDQRDLTSKADDWLWTGSWNVSIAGEDDINNVVMVRDFGLAEAYTREFDEMWGSSTMTPNWSEAKMGSRKSDNTPHTFRINDILFEQYMSPSDGTASKIIEKIEAADHSIYFCILSFTQYQISNAMKDQRDAVPDLEVRGVFYEGIASYEDGGSQWYPMSGDPVAWNYWDPPADVWLDTALPSSKLLHHKYVVVDANSWSDPVVSTGSHNWSYSASSRNDENTVMIHDRMISNLFLQEFADRYHESGGTGSLGELAAVSDGSDLVPVAGLALHQNVPNPFNPSTTISFENRVRERISLKVYDTTGRLVRTLIAGNATAPGAHVVGWDGKNDHGEPVASGVYLCRLEGEKRNLTKKMLLLK